MPSNENKAPEKKTEKETNVTKFEATKAAKPKRKLNLGWWLGMIVLILIAITFVLPTGVMFTGNTNNELVFGKYGKDDISFAYGNYFYNQYQNAASQYSNSGLNATQAAYQIWWSAYQNTVVHTALTQMAKRAGIIASLEAVNQAIIDSGVYDKDGKFDVSTYNSLSADSKANIQKQYTEALPATMVMNDISSVVSSSAEASYVGDMAAATRTFDYVVFGASSYPDDLAREYAMNDPQQFVEMEVSMFTLSDEEVAKQVAADIAAGKLSFEEASSQYDVGAAFQKQKLAYYALATNFADEAGVNQLFASVPGTVVGPFASPYGYYSMYRADSSPAVPDFNDAATLGAVKQYLASNQSETVSQYANERASAFAEAAKSDFDVALDEFDAIVSSVGSTPANVGGSSYMSSFASTDTNQALATASSDRTVMRQLFTEPVGTVVGPFASGSNFVVAKISGDEASTSMSDYITMFYDYAASNQSQQDLVQAMFSSDDFKDDFMSVFFSQILGSAATE